MAQDSEKRFHQIMDKLFHGPKSTPASSPSSSSGAQLSRGKKRPNTSSALALVEPKMRLDMVDGSPYSSAPAESSQTPLCRPWDRGDLMRRLATFKSMTWFAKPKVVSAVNCARKGWVNVDMDIIACEACGARLLFSTPSSWTQQQVEKAALVFSLKLDNGHKLICPWIDNACDETLAEFPPTMPQDLIVKFRERSSALLQLLELPVISLSAIECMRSPELEEFLRESTILEYDNMSVDLSQSEPLGHESEADSAKLYYQAQKLISLCGWEPRLLPYVVDCKDKSYQFVNDAEIFNLPQEVSSQKNLSINMHSADTDESSEANEKYGVQDGLESDPKSVVLDCRLCGASVGLWAFSTVPKPLELFRVVGYTEVNNENNSRPHNSGIENHCDNTGGIKAGASHGKQQMPNLKLTIAGGPPATAQNFKATITLPVIGRNLRARFSCQSQFRDRNYDNQDDTHSKLKNKNQSLAEKQGTGCNISEQVDQSENTGLLEHRKEDQEHQNSMDNHLSPSQRPEVTQKGDTLPEDNNNPASSGERNISGEGTFESNRNDSNVENLMEVSQNTEVGFSRGDGEAAQNDLLEATVSDICKGQELVKADMPCSKEMSLASHQEPSCDSSCFHSEEAKNHSDVQENVTAKANIQEGVGKRMQTPGIKKVHTLENNNVNSSTAGNNLKQLSFDKVMVFDPIMQHRHFCPWIVSTASRAPGWRQTLGALLREKDFGHPDATKSPSSPSLIEVDDPVTSVRKLFMSPSEKRRKCMRRLS